MPKTIENLRDKILTEGRSMLLNSNYSEYTIREIAKRCGIASGTFYNYFESKEMLAYEVFKSDWDRTLGVIQEMKISDVPLRYKLKLLFDAMENFIDSYLSVFHDMSSDTQANMEFITKKNSVSDEHKNLSRCPVNDYQKVYDGVCEILIYEIKKGYLRSDIDPKKFSIFIVTNMFHCIKNKYMSFDELINCIRL